MNFIPLPMTNFDVILGMDFLSNYCAVIDCLSKVVVFQIPDEAQVKICGDGALGKCHLISSLRESALLQQGCSTFLAYVVDVQQSGPSISDTPVVCEFADVFPDELPGIVPDREIEFTIELVSGANPISIAPYRMALEELLRVKGAVKRISRQRVY